ncbi:MAG: TetR family transcriptional regulator [Bdellovibrionota bacterium]
MRKSKKETNRTRMELLSAAQKVFSSKGYSSATLEEIAAEAGVTRGAIYHHFKNGKPAVLNALCEDRYGRLSNSYAILESDVGARTKLESIINAYFEALESDPEFADLQYILVYKTELSDELMGGMEQKISSTRMLIDLYTNLIQSLLKSTKMPPSLTANQLATVIVSFQSGLTNLWLVDRTAVDLKHESSLMVKALLDSLIDE